jgi:NAD(P)-dependent dehydrogenase (short-subunit alcohol dehydrogenase family)
MKLSNKIVLVTGGTSGLGLEAAKLFREEVLKLRARPPRSKVYFEDFSHKTCAGDKWNGGSFPIAIIFYND